MNVLLIGVENLRADGVGCCDSPQGRTPNLDRFTTRATRFTRCYCQSPMGDQSRSSLLTGMRPGAAMASKDRNPQEPPKEPPSLPEILHQYGLRTTDVGGCPRDHEPCERVARVAARVLAEAAEKQAPFSMSIGLAGPHRPLPCPRAHLDLSDPDPVGVPQAPACRDRNILPTVKRSYGGQSSPVTNAASREAVRAYYGHISLVDAQIGTLLDALDRVRLSSDTIVMIFSHCGFHLGEKGLWGVPSLFEQSTRVPLLVRVPGVTNREVVCDEIVELVDLLPTICDLLAVPMPDHLEGKSFVPLLCDPLQPWKRAAFTVLAADQCVGRSVRTKRWRYTDWQSHTTSSRQFELYDLDADPQERTNLALYPDFRNEHTILANLLQRGWRAAQ